MATRRKTRSDALPEWLRRQRRDHARAKWRKKHRDAGRCDRCGRCVPVHPLTCDDCREKHRTYQRAIYQRRQRMLKKEGLPTKKLERSLVLLARKAWTPAEFAAARWPEDPANPRKAGGTRVLGVATKTLRGLERRGLAAMDGDRFILTEHGRQVLRHEVPTAVKEKVA